MKFKLLENYLYHVTHTDKVPLIQKKGLLPMQTSNWVKGGGDRYGQGEVYAFTDLKDAIRWAARMDWDFNKNIGTGKISVLRFKKSSDWEIDENDPMSQASKKGDWLKKIGRVMPEEIDKTVPITTDITQKLTDWDAEFGEEIFQ